MAKDRFAGMSEKMKKVVEKSDLQVSKKIDNSLIEIEIDTIENPPFHDRYSVDNTAIKELAEDISQHGLINPITVRKLNNGKYQRISGYRRIEAYRLLGKKKISAIPFKADDEIKILELMFSENKQRENPSEYDTVIFHLEALSYILNIKDQDLKNLISKARKIEQGSLKTKDIELLEKVNLIKELLNKTKEYPSINTFYQKMTNILSLDKILIDAIQSKKIYYTVANELNKVLKSNKNKKEIDKFLEQSIDKNYSLREAKKAVKDFLKEEPLPLDERRGYLKNKLKKIINKISIISEDEIEKLERTIVDLEI